jgi:hypothetical protein
MRYALCALRVAVVLALHSEFRNPHLNTPTFLWMKPLIYYVD